MSSNRSPGLREEITRLDADAAQLKGILMTSPYSETAETQFLFSSQLGHHGPSALASQARLPPAFLVIPRFYALHDRAAQLVEESANLKRHLETLQETVDKLTTRVADPESGRYSKTIPDPGTPPTAMPRTPPYGPLASSPSAPRKRRESSPESAVPKKKNLPGHAPSRSLPNCLLKPSNEEI